MSKTANPLNLAHVTTLTDEQVMEIVLFAADLYRGDPYTITRTTDKIVVKGTSPDFKELTITIGSNYKVRVTSPKTVTINKAQKLENKGIVDILLIKYLRTPTAKPANKPRKSPYHPGITPAEAAEERQQLGIDNPSQARRKL